MSNRSAVQWGLLRSTVVCFKTRKELLANHSHPAKIDLNKKWLPKQKTIQNFNIDALGFRKTRHGLAGNSYFLNGRIFIFCFSESLGINIEILKALLLW